MNDPVTLVELIVVLVVSSALRHLGSFLLYAWAQLHDGLGEPTDTRAGPPQGVQWDEYDHWRCNIWGCSTIGSGLTTLGNHLHTHQHWQA